MLFRFTAILIYTLIYHRQHCVRKVSETNVYFNGYTYRRRNIIESAELVPFSSKSVSCIING